MYRPRYARFGSVHTGATDLGAGPSLARTLRRLLCIKLPGRRRLFIINAWHGCSGVGGMVAN
jgi:hypothetical protein